MYDHLHFIENEGTGLRIYADMSSHQWKGERAHWSKISGIIKECIIGFLCY